MRILGMARAYRAGVRSAAVGCIPCLHKRAPRAHDPGQMGEVRARASAGPIGNAVQFYWVMEPLLAGERQEVAHVMLLDIHGRMVRVREVGRGTYDSVEVPIPFALRAALGRRDEGSARYVILSHNHPAGWAWPSEDDAELTDAMASAAAEIDLVLLDHVVIGRREVFSFAEDQLWTIKS